jgi:hypothetical protein
MSFDARQTVIVDSTASAGHVVAVPLHDSATSHSPADTRQTVIIGLNVSTGHDTPEPVQFSAASHMPADGRH